MKPERRTRFWQRLARLVRVPLPELLVDPDLEAVAAWRALLTDGDQPGRRT